MTEMIGHTQGQTRVYKPQTLQFIVHCSNFELLG